MYEYLCQQFPDTELMAYADHHAFSRRDIQQILEKAERYAHVVTTEKDYMRMQQTPLVEALGDKLRVLTIQTNLGVDKEGFDRAVLLYVRENNRNNKRTINS